MKCSKTDAMAYVSKSISMPHAVHEVAVARQKKFGYSSLSDYIQALILQDVSETHSRHPVPTPEVKVNLAVMGLPKPGVKEMATEAAEPNPSKSTENHKRQKRKSGGAA